MLALVIPNDSNLDVVKNIKHAKAYSCHHSSFKRGIYRYHLKSNYKKISVDECCNSYPA